jgi:hypothetical protein
VSAKAGSIPGHTRRRPKLYVGHAVIQRPLQRFCQRPASIRSDALVALNVPDPDTASRRASEQRQSCTLRLLLGYNGLWRGCCRIRATIEPRMTVNTTSLNLADTELARFVAELRDLVYDEATLVRERVQGVWARPCPHAWPMAAHSHPCGSTRLAAMAGRADLLPQRVALSRRRYAAAQSRRPFRRPAHPGRA